MLKMQDQFCSFELAKQLYELKVDQKSIVSWYELKHLINTEYFPETDSYKETILETRKELSLNTYSIRRENIINTYAAFSLFELLELLPAFVDTNINKPFNVFYLSIEKRTAKNIQYIINYHCDCISEENFTKAKLIQHSIHAENSTEAVAKMLVYLIENNLYNLTDKENI